MRVGRVLWCAVLCAVLSAAGCGDSARGDARAPDAAGDSALDLPADVALETVDGPGDVTIDVRGDGPSPDATFDSTRDAPLPDVAAPDASDLCATPQRLTFSGGRASATGTTRGYSDEHPALTCSGDASAPALVGADRYHVFTASAGKTYEIRATVARQAVIYGFAQSVGCTRGAIQSACASAGAQGFRLLAAPTAPNVLLFAPSAAGDYVIAIDAVSLNFAGDYSIEVIERSTPSNQRCAQPQTITLTNGRAVIDADSRGATDELPALTCSGASPFVGAQLYYEIDAKAGRAYQLTLEPTFDAYLYVFAAAAACTQTAVQASCSDGGNSGASFTSALAPGGRRTLLFQPSNPGRYKIAVDSWIGSAGGPFRLTVDEIVAPANDSCSAAQALTVPSAGAAVTASGNLLLASDEHPSLDCGVTSAGMPLALGFRDAFYRFDAVQGRRYAVSVRSDFDALIYVWNDSSASCTQPSIEAGCVGTAGADGDHSLVSNGTSFVFTAKQTASYGLGVELVSGDSGGYTVRIAEHTPPSNTTCAAAQALTLGSGGKVSVSGDTTGVPDEFPTLSCSSVFANTRMVGSNLYYSFDGVAGRIYRISLDARFAGYVLVFDGQANCVASDVQISCGSHGATGDSFPSAVFAGSLLFKPPRDGKYVIAVDSFNAVYMGSFSLTLEDVGAIPAHATCAGAKQVTLSAGSTTVSDDTTLAVDQFSILKCGGLSQKARQLYYRFAASAGKTYRFELSPAFDAYAYVFPASTNCVFSAIDSACASGGSSGALSPFTIAGTTSAMTFTPSTSGDIIVAVDSTDGARFGAFDLKITEQ